MANPALKDSTLQTMTRTQPGQELMTRRGVFGALAFYMAVLVVAAGAGWFESSKILTKSAALLYVPLIAAFVLSLVIIRSPRVAKALGIVYAVLEGLVLGVISQVYNAQYHGIVLEAVGVTAGVALVVWFLYGTGVIKVSSKMYRIVGAATLGAMAFYLVSIVMMLFGGPNLDAGGGVVGVGISLVLAAIAAANFLLDLDRVEQLLIQGAGAEYDWYMAFAMLVSLIWLYLEILRVLSKLRR